jgi:hypothetical protein
MKTETTTIACDNCGQDISPKVTNYPRADILVLACQNMAISSGYMYAVVQYPKLERAHHFCGFRCLGEWAEKHKGASSVRSETPPIDKSNEQAP